MRVGNQVWVAGTTAVAAAGVVGGSDAGLQTREVLRRIGDALREVGADYEHVVRTRIFVTDIAQWEAIGREHGAVFTDIRPAATMVEVAALIDPELLVEIEVDAVVTAAN